MDQPEIVIYYASVCGLCTKAIDFLRSRNLAFHAKPVVWDAAADAFVDTPVSREMFDRCGGKVDFVPQIFIGDQHIAGWRKLEPMIASGDFDQRLLASPVDGGGTQKGLIK